MHIFLLPSVSGFLIFNSGALRCDIIKPHNNIICSETRKRIA